MFKFRMLTEDEERQERKARYLALPPVDAPLTDDDLSEDASWGRYEAAALADWQDEQPELWKAGQSKE